MTTPSRPLHALLLCVLLMGALPAASATPTLLRDIRPGTDDSLLSGALPVVIGDTTYFSGEVWGTGREPWKTDGTPESTVLIKDVRPGYAASSPGGFTALGSSVLFLALDDSGLGLWKTDGTGTVLLRASTRIIFPSARNMARAGQLVFFGAELDENGEELWKTDGTQAGTVRVTDIAPGAASSQPSRLTPMGNQVFFTVTDGAASRSSLWRSDGTAAGTVKLWEPNTGTTSLQFNWLASSGTAFFMSVRQNTTNELWTSDGTPAGTTRLATLGTGTARAYAFLGNQLVFSHGSGLGKSDGTSAGTSTWTAETPVSTSNMVEWGGSVYFLGDSSSPAGLALWRTTGSSGGNTLVSVVKTSSSGFINVSGAGLTVMGGRLYFYWNTLDTSRSTELWTSDGTSGGTSQLLALGSPEDEFAVSQLSSTSQRLYFRVDHWHGQESLSPIPTIWMSDGTQAGTGPLQRRASPAGIRLYGSTMVGSALHFFTDDGTHGPELWRSDGTPEGTLLLRDILPGPVGSVSSLFTYDSKVMNGVRYFIADDGTHGLELWRSDDTTAGTTLVKDIHPGGASSLSSSTRLAVLNGTLYFTADDGEHGIELWRSNGTPEGTTLVGDVVPGPGGLYDHFLQAVGDKLFFVSAASEHGLELWKSDGTAPGTAMVKDIYPGEQGAFDYTYELVPGSNGVVYFVADDGIHGSEPWRSDGTPEGTFLLKDCNPHSTEIDVDLTMIALGNTLYLAAQDGEHGRELWKSDGTPEGTVLIKDLEPGPLGSEPITSSLTRLGSQVYFVAHDGTHGFELWRTDGTSEGTARVTDVRPGPGSGVLPYSGMLALEDRGLLLFTGMDDAHGLELWMTDGTPEGTSLLADINPGLGSSTPISLRQMGERLFMVADNGTDGIEPLVVPLPDRTAPQLTCPGPTEAQAQEPSGAEVSYPAATASDDQGSASVEYSHPSGSRFPVGTTVVTVTATDTSGNRKQCSFEVRVAAPPEPLPEKSAGCACHATSGTAGPAIYGALLLLIASMGTRHGWR